VGKVIEIKPLKLGPSDFAAEIKRLKAAGRMPSLETVLAAVAETRAKYRGKIQTRRSEGQ
jgi:hypothetical protein